MDDGDTKDGTESIAAKLALNACAHLAVIALQRAASGEAVECGRVLRRLELEAFPHPELATRAYLFSSYLETFALERWSTTRARRASASPTHTRTKRSRRAPSI